MSTVLSWPVSDSTECGRACRGAIKDSFGDWDVRAPVGWEETDLIGCKYFEVDHVQVTVWKGWLTKVDEDVDRKGLKYCRSR